MERRTAIRNMLIIAGGIAILPSCSPDKKKATIALNKLDVSKDQEDLLAEIAETIIPETNTPGAKKLNLHLFVMKMVDDCHEHEQQLNFVKGADELNALSEKQFNTDFMNASKEQRLELLKQLEDKKDTSSALNDFYSIMKGRTIQGYMNSKYVMTELIPYELIPGRYNGFFPVKNS